MEFKLVELGGQNYAFQNEQEQSVIAEIEWTETDGQMVMTHTYVSDQLRGQGVAKKLLDRAADYAREHDLKMKPVCSYVVSAFERSNEYDDVKA